MRNSTRRSFAVHQFPEHRSSPSCLLIPRLRGRRERERETHLLSPSFLTALSYSSTRSSPRFFPLPRFLPFPPGSKGCAALRGYCLPSYGRERRLRYLFNANWKMLRLSLCLSFFLLKSGGGGARLTKLTESGASFCTYMLRICRKEPLSRPVSVFVSLRFLAFLASRGVKSSHVSSTFTCLVERSVISAGHFRRLKLFERTIGTGMWSCFIWNVIISPVFANWKFLLKLVRAYTSRLYIFPWEGGRISRNLPEELK